MKLNDVISKLSLIRPGVFTRLTYKSELPMRAEFKKQGYKIVKITSMTTRFGINYGHIKDVMENTVESSKQRVNNFSWVLKNNVQYNSNTDCHYLCTYPTKSGRNSRSSYLIYLPSGDVVTKMNLDDSIKEMVQQSHWNKSGDTKMMKIKIGNIIRIGDWM